MSSLRCHVFMVLSVSNEIDGLKRPSYMVDSENLRSVEPAGVVLDAVEALRWY